MTLGVKGGGDTLGLGGGAGEGDDTLHWGWVGGGRFIPSPPVSFRMIISRPFFSRSGPFAAMMLGKFYYYLGNDAAFRDG